MTDHSITHATFVLERTYAAAPTRVFAAWASRDAKLAWFGLGPDELKTFDFRVGGHESSAGNMPTGTAYTFDATYQNIIPDERIVYTYDMTMDGAPISVSLSTIELVPRGSGTRLIYTEQGAYLDGLDTAAQREEGTAELLDALGRSLDAA